MDHVVFGGVSPKDSWILKATKQRMAPVHRRSASHANSCLQNLTHSGVVGRGHALGPSQDFLRLFRAVALCGEETGRKEPLEESMSQRRTWLQNSDSTFIAPV